MLQLFYFTTTVLTKSYQMIRNAIFEWLIRSNNNSNFLYVESLFPLSIFPYCYFYFSFVFNLFFTKMGVLLLQTSNQIQVFDSTKQMFWICGLLMAFIVLYSFFSISSNFNKMFDVWSTWIYMVIFFLLAYIHESKK